MKGGPVFRRTPGRAAVVLALALALASGAIHARAEIPRTDTPLDKVSRAPRAPAPKTADDPVSPVPVPNAPPVPAGGGSLLAEGADAEWSVREQPGMRRALGPQAPADMRHDPVAAALPPSGVSAQAAPAVADLALALGNDALAIYNWVKTTIAFEPIYGLLRGPERTIRERSGTDSDQAHLLVELLRAAGYPADYRYGTVTLPLGLAADTVRVDVAPSVFETCNRVFRAFVMGGVPVSPSQPCGNDQTQEFIVQHVFVAATVGGTLRELDPSVKAGVRNAQIDLATALGYNRSAFVAAAEQGATVGANSLVRLNTANVTGDLERYAANLVARLDATTPHATVRQVVGGWELDEPPAPMLPTVLPYPRTIAASFSSFDQPGAPELRHKVSVSITSPSISYASTLAALVDRRLTYRYTGTTGVLRLDGTQVAAAGAIGTTQRIDYCVDGPSPAAGGAYGDECQTRIVVVGSGNTYALVSEVGRAPLALLEHRREILAENRKTFADNSEEVLGESLHIMGLSWFHENGASERLHEGVARVNGYRFHGLAVMAQEGTTTPNFGIDVRLNLVLVYSYIRDTNDERIYFTAGAAQGSGIEHGFLEQLQGVEGISTIRILDIANAQGMPIFLGTSSNWGTVRPQLSYSAGLLASLDNAIVNGYQVIVPRTTVTLNQWTGAGWIQYRSDSEGYLISGSLKGGYGTEPGEIDPLLIVDDIGRVVRLIDPALDVARELDPLDPKTGAYLQPVRDLAIAGDAPASLGGFDRSYNSRVASIDGALGFGWRNELERSLSIRTDYARGLDGPKAQDAARLIAQVYVVQDMIRSTLPQHELRAVHGIAITWGMERLQRNTFVLSGASSAVFTELPGGRYSVSAAAPWRLIRNGDGSITLDGPRGHVQHYAALPGERWRLASWSDANGHIMAPTYDTGGKMIRIDDGVGRAYTITYAGTRIAQISDPAGRIQRYSYDAAGNLATATDPMGRVVTYTYDADHRLISVTDPLGIETVRNTYLRDRVVDQRDARGGRSTVAYGSGVTRIVDPLGGARTITYDPQGLRSTVTDEAGSRLVQVFDGAGNIAQVIEPGGASSTFSYDAECNRTRAVDPLGHILRFEYDAGGFPTKVIDPAGHETSYARDARGNISSITDAVGQTMQFNQYDALGRLLRMTEPHGAVIRFTYDAWGTMTSRTDAMGATTSFTNDVLGRLVSIRDAVGNLTTTEFDAMGRTTKATDPTGAVVRYEYDAAGRLVRSIDPLGRERTQAFDPAGNLLTLTRADGTAIRFEYDTLNRLVTLIDPRGGRWSVERDGAGAMVAEQDPLGNRRTYMRNADGRVTRRTDALGRITTYTYDAAGNLLATAYGDGSQVTTTYNIDGLPATSSYRGNTITYTYDALHRIVSEAHSNGRRLDHTYDSFGGASSPGDRMRMVLSAGGQPKETVTYGYDAGHRLISHVSGAGTTAFAYDTLGRLIRRTFPNGTTSERTYDAGSRLVRLDNLDAGGNAIGASAFTVDAAGRIERVATTTPSAASTFEYTYDALDRLIREKGPRTDVSYTYDAAGNRLTRTDAAGVVASAYDAANRLLTAAGGFSYTYDANGNLTRKTTPAGATTFSWDYEDRLAGITPSYGGTVSYVYDAAGRQVSRTEGTAASVATYDGMQLLAEGPANLGTGSIFGGGIGSIETRRDLGGAAVTFALDRLGGVTDISDTAGAPREALRHDAFGFAGAESGFDPGLLGFAGDSGATREPSAPWLVRMGLRYYDTEAGRFITRDPMGFLAGDANLYAFVGNSPTNFTDSTGLFLDIILDIGFIAYDIYKLATGGRDEFWINMAALGADVGGALIPFATGTGAATRVALNAGPDAARALGKSGELASGIVKNTEHIPVPGGYRIPDKLDHANKVIGDVKNYTKLSYTRQLRDFVAYAKQNGYRMELIVDNGTKLTGPLEEAVRRGDIILKRKALR